MPHSTHPDTARRLVVFSDIEMGVGGPTDDFPRTEWFAGLLEGQLSRTPPGVELHLVFNGDTFDFLKATLADGTHPRFVTPEVALAKLERVAAAHAEFFRALGGLLAAPAGRCHAVFVTGNHDLELVLPVVEERLRELLGSPSRLRFVGEGVAFGDTWIEHGNQEDPMFRFDFDEPTVSHGGDEVLKLPWGSVGLIDVMLPLHDLLCHHDRMRPRGRVFELMPELRRLLVGRSWRYWSRDYLRRWWGGADPLARVSWNMFREIAWRMGTANTAATVASRYRARLEKGTYRVIVIGHEHTPAWFTWADRKLLVTGCLRCEFALSEDGETETLLPSVYAEIDQDGSGRTLSSELREVLGPEPPPGWRRQGIFGVRDEVNRLLAQDEDGTDAEADSERQVALEDGTR